MRRPASTCEWMYRYNMEVMNPLVHFLRFFTIWFGLTQSRPQEEGKHAFILALVLAGTALFVFVAIGLVVVFFR
jgi:hypothetical protein